MSLFLLLSGQAVMAENFNTCTDVFADLSLKRNASQRVKNHESYADYLSNISRDFLTKEQENILIENVQKKGPDWQRDQKIIFENNALLVADIVHRNFKEQSTTLTKNDFLQAGNLGLLKAIDRFELGRDLKFSTYAAFWVREQIYDEIKKVGRPIRLPVYVLKNLSEFHKTKEKMEQQYYRENGVYKDISSHEVAKAIGLSDQKFSELIPYLNIYLHEAQREFPDSPEPVELVESRLGVVSTQAIESEQVSIRLKSAIERLSEKEKTVVKLFFNLEGEQKNKIEIAKILNYKTGNPVRIILKGALHTLREELEREESVDLLEAIEFESL